MTSKGYRKFWVACFVYKFHRFWDGSKTCSTVFVSEKNGIAALYKAGLKGPAIAQETKHLLPTIYGVLKRFKQCGTVENEERSGRSSICAYTTEYSKTLYGVVKSDKKRPLQEVTNIY